MLDTVAYWVHSEGCDSAENVGWRLVFKIWAWCTMSKIPYVGWIDQLIIVKSIVIVIITTPILRHLWINPIFWRVLYYIRVESIPWGTKYQINAILRIRNCVIVNLIIIWLRECYTVYCIKVSCNNEESYNYFFYL